MIISDSDLMGQLMFGYASKMTSERSGLRVEVFDFTSALNQSINMSTQYNCPHEFGGLMCGVVPTVHKAVVSDITGPNELQITTNSPEDILSLVFDPQTGNAVNTVDRYETGRIKLLSGPFAGAEYYIENLNGPVGNDWVIRTRKPIPGTKMLGSVVAVYIGCQKTFPACTDNSGGLLRFWGFPNMVSSSKVYVASTSIPNN